MTAPSLEWVLWKRTLYFTNDTRLDTSTSNTDCLWDMVPGTIPIFEEPARLAMRISRFACPFVFGTFNQTASPPGSTFAIREWLNGSLLQVVQISIFDGTPAEIPSWYANGIQIADRLNIILNSRCLHHYSVSYDIHSAFLRFEVLTPGAEFDLNFGKQYTSNPCPLALGFPRETWTDPATVLYSQMPILSSSFLNIDIRMPQLAGGSYSDNDPLTPIHPSNVFGRLSLGAFQGLNYITKEFENYYIINNSEIFNGSQFNIKLTTEKPNETVPLPPGTRWNIELEFICYIPAYTSLLTTLRHEPALPHHKELLDKTKTVQESGDK